MDHWKLLQRIATGVFRRWKRLALLSFVAALLVLGTAAYYLSKEPPRYRASATVLLEARPGHVPVFEEFSPARPLSVQLAILRSTSLAEGVLESLPKTAIQDLTERQYHVDYMLAINNAYRRLRGLELEVEQPQQNALKELQQGRMKFELGEDGIVQITADAGRPQAAIDIVNTYIEVLLSRTRSFNIADARTSREFLEQQFANVRNSLKASEEALRIFTTAHGGITIPERSHATVDQLSQAENALAELTANRRMLETRLQGLRQKVETQKTMSPAASSSTTLPPRPPVAGVQRLQAQLAQLETTLLELRMQFTDAHPRVINIKDRISEVQRQLGDVVRETTPVTPLTGAVPSAERINFSEQVIAMETALHTLTAQEEALRKQAEAFRQSLSGLSRSELEYARFMQEVETNRNLYRHLSDKLIGARIREQGEMKVVKIIDPAGYPKAMPSEKRTRYLGMALILALAIGGGIPAVVESIQRTVETEDDVTSATGLPVLAVLPRLRLHRPTLVIPQDHPRSAIDGDFIFSEAMRNLRVTIQLSLRREGPCRLLITSPFAAEGKSTVLANLASAFSDAGYRVVLADTDFQRPTLHDRFAVSPSYGLTDVLGTDRAIGDCFVPVGERMWVAPRGGPLQPKTRGMLATRRLNGLIDDIARQADVVLCDSSPVLLIPDNMFLAAAVDAVILVAKVGSTRCRDLARTKSLLEGSGAKVMGVVVNEMPVSALRRHYKRYYTKYLKTEVTHEAH